MASRNRPRSTSPARRRAASTSSTASAVPDAAALYEAAYPGDPAAMRRLLAAGGDPDGQPLGARDTVLELAAANDDCPAIARLLVAAGATVTPRAVCRAAKTGAAETLALLLRNGGDPNGKMPWFKRDMRLAALNLIEGDDKTRRRKLGLLLAAGADVNRTDGLERPVAASLVADRALAPRVFPLASAAARRSILNHALFPRGTESNTRDYMLHVARLFLGARGFAGKRKDVTAAIDDHLAKRPKAQARYKRLLTGSAGK